MRSGQIFGLIVLLWLLPNVAGPSIPHMGASPILSKAHHQLQRVVQRGIDSIFAYTLRGRPVRYAMAIQLLPDGTLVYKHNHTAPMIPASLNKLILSAAALDLLGSNFSIPTLLYGDTIVTGDSLYPGNLYLVGSADPLLSTADLDSLAAQVYRRGIRLITGNVYIDDSFTDSVWQRKTYSGDRDIVQATPPITALAVERNTLTVTLTGANRSGQRPTITVFPHSSQIVIVNRAITGSGRYSSRRIKIRTHRLSDGRQRLTVYGKISRRRRIVKRVYMLDPPLIAGDLLKQALQRYGIEVKGAVYRRPLPYPHYQLGVVQHSLDTLITLINRASDNYVAEQLFKMLGGYVTNDRYPLTAERARVYLQQWLKQQNIPCKQCAFQDGSGLSRRNRTTAATLLAILTRTLHQPYATAFIRSLSIAGTVGTLKKRLRNSPAAGSVLAKTGTLRNVSGLAGYVLNQQGAIFAFVILFQGRSISQFKQLEDQIVEFLYNVSLPQPLAPPVATGPPVIRPIPQTFLSQLHTLFTTASSGS